MGKRVNELTKATEEDLVASSSLLIDTEAGTKGLPADLLLSLSMLSKLPSSQGFAYDNARAIKAFGKTRDVSYAQLNTIWNVDGRNDICIGLPEETYGFLITMCGNPEKSESAYQLFISYEGVIYSRTRWGTNTITYQGWKRLLNSDDVGNLSTQELPHIISQFLKIGACGGSLCTGASYYQDSNGELHGIDNADYSWIQLWGRKHGVSAFNFSQGGMSTKTWLSQANGLQKAQIADNKCKAYFLLFGGNDIRDYGEANLGSIADVNVGNETSNPETYFGNYSKIIANLKNIGGQKTKIFAFTYATNFNSNELISTFNQATKDVCALYDDVFVIDLENDSVINGEEITQEKYNGHFSAHGYKLIADRLEYLIDKFVADNPSYFKDIQFIGTDYDIVEC